MLARSFRLRKYEVERVRKKGELRHGSYFNIRILKNQADHFRAAIVIPKRIIAKAVDRNRLKRKIAECLAKNNLSNFDIMIILKINAKEQELINEMARFKIDSHLPKNPIA